MISNKKVSARVDENQPDIVRNLRKIPGIAVSLDHDDILIGYKGNNYWIEIKAPSTLNKNGTVNKKHIKESQVKLLQNWPGQYAVCWTFEDILDVLGIEQNPKKLCGHCWLESESNDPTCICGE